MKRIVITFGLISGAILSVMMAATVPFMDKIGLGDGGSVAGFNNGSGETLLPRFTPPFTYGKRGTRKSGGGGPAAPSKPEPKSKSPFSQKD